MMLRAFFVVTLFAYMGATFFYLAALTSTRRGLEKAGLWCLLGGFVLHVVSTGARYAHSGFIPITSLHESLSFLALCMGGFLIYLMKTYRTGLLGGIVLPAISIVLIWALTLPYEIKPIPPVLDSYWMPFHTVFAFLGNAIFFTAFLVSIVYLGVERQIKKKKLHSHSARLPSLETLDLINYRCISYGFPFLTLGIITGSLWAQLAWGSYWSWDPKETWSLITWIVYAVILHNRLTMGWRGRKTAYMMILGFVSIVVTFLGVNFIVGGLHSYL
jgi:cytochrome c-type biogenesis protein CcsB